MDALRGDIKRIALLAIGIVILIIGFYVPAPEGLSGGGKMTLVILVFLFVMWTGRVVPNWVSSVAAMLMLPFFGAADSLSVVYSSFINSTFFFLLAVFGIAAMVHKSSLPVRLMEFFIGRFGRNSKKLLFAFAATTWIVSAFMSDLASCAIVAGIALALVKEVEFPKTFSRCLMMVIPLGSMTGGIIMPISSATNATIMQLLFDMTGETVNFLQWTMVGAPVGLLGLFLSWGLTVLIFRPEPLSDECMVALRSRFNTQDGLSFYDKKVLALVCAMLALWVSGSWIKVFDSTFVALLGMIVMFLPGINLLTWEDYKKEVPWDLLLFVGALFALCSAMVRCGTIDWIMAATLGGSGGWSATMFFVAMSVVLVLLRGVLPGGPLLVAMVTPGVLAMGAAFGLSPIQLLIALSVWGQVNCLIPIIDGQWLMTYNFGYFTTTDLLKVGIPFAIVMTVALTLLLPALAGFSYVVA